MEQYEFTINGVVHAAGSDWLPCPCGNYHRFAERGAWLEFRWMTPEAFAAEHMYTIVAPHGKKEEGVTPQS